ncbi:FadR/GntR family transcriptional regulator [Soonwooa sp.]|uniref:FadR/GntR family transcriptional regulator n=1 Tax=Soonwooa sp. TaxID=1938592 RepID=UPI002622166E|nr:FadR/GntR family transcriptional regulator [Soonwooa sp.]
MTKILQKKSLAERLSDLLRDEIAEGKYEVGQKLPTETQMEKMYGVGRSTVREAIKTLSNIGLLSVRQGSGTFVEKQIVSEESFEHRMLRSSINELNEVREILELKIAEKAALKRTPEDLENIKKYLDLRGKYANEGNLDMTIESDIQFHLAIAKASYNDMLFDIYKATSEHLKKWFHRNHKSTAPLIESHGRHVALYNCIKDGDALNAWKASELIISLV